MKFGTLKTGEKMQTLYLEILECVICTSYLNTQHTYLTKIINCIHLIRANFNLFNF